MLPGGPWRKVSSREKWRGRRDAGRAHLKSARNALELANGGDDLRLVVQGAILATIAYADALTIKVAGIKNTDAHERLPDTLRHALGKRIPQTELTRVTRLLASKDESAYGIRFFSLEEARDALEKAEAFAAWVEAELTV